MFVGIKSLQRPQFVVVVVFHALSRSKSELFLTVSRKRISYQQLKPNT